MVGKSGRCQCLYHVEKNQRKTAGPLARIRPQKSSEIVVGQLLEVSIVGALNVLVIPESNDSSRPKAIPQIHLLLAS